MRVKMLDNYNKPTESLVTPEREEIKTSYNKKHLRNVAGSMDLTPSEYRSPVPLKDLVSVCIIIDH